MLLNSYPVAQKCGFLGFEIISADPWFHCALQWMLRWVGGGWGKGGRKQKWEGGPSSDKAGPVTCNHRNHLYPSYVLDFFIRLFLKTQVWLLRFGGDVDGVGGGDSGLY